MNIFGVAPYHCFESVHYVVAMFPRRIEAEHPLQSIQKFAARVFG